MNPHFHFRFAEIPVPLPRVRVESHSKRALRATFEDLAPELRQQLSPITFESTKAVQPDMWLLVGITPQESNPNGAPWLGLESLMELALVNAGSCKYHQRQISEDTRSRFLANSIFI